MAHLLINGCRQRRAVQLAIQSLRIVFSCDGVTQTTQVPPSSQRLWTTAAPLAAATAAPEDGAAPRPSKRRTKYNHDDIFESAERLFETSVEADHEATPDEDAPPNEAISAELLEEFEVMIENIDKKRSRRPIKLTGETLESWLERNSFMTEPFLAFLARHNAPQDRTVAALFASGERGRRLMMGFGDGPRSMLREMTEENVETPYELAFAAWGEALAREGVPLPAEDLLQRWPVMLVRSPVNMPTTLAVLRAALPDAVAAVAAMPSLLGATPLELQGRLVQLQLATEGELPTMLASEPRLLARHLPSILSNLRFIRALSRSAREFRSFLHTDPSALCKYPIKLQAGADAVKRSLGRALPPGVDPAAVIAAKPQLVLVRGSWLAARWRDLCAEADTVEEWRRQLDSVVEAAVSGEGQQGASIATTASEVPSAPEWINVDTEPKSLGIPATSEQDGAAAAAADDEEPEEAVSEAEHRSRRAYSALGEALLMKPWRLQRLRYIVETEGIKGAGQVSLIGALTVQLEQFLEQYPGFEEWRLEKEEEARETRLQRRRERQQQWEEDEEDKDEEAADAEHKDDEDHSPQTV